MPTMYIINPENDTPMVITIEVANFVVMKTLVDQGSSVDILYMKTFWKIGLSPDVVISHDKQIVGFLGEHVDTWGYIDLYTKFREEDWKYKTIKVPPSGHWDIIKRPSRKTLFEPIRGSGINPTPSDLVSFRGRKSGNRRVNQKTTQKWYVANLKIPFSPAKTNKCETDTSDFDLRPNDEPRIEPKEETMIWKIGHPKFHLFQIFLSF